MRLANLQIRNSDLDARYLGTYPLFLDFFKTRIAVEPLALSDAKIAIVLVYSWMGRAQFDPSCWDNFERASAALNRIRSQALDVQAIEAIKSFVGHSLIATSKFLHFFDPEQYAIWDSNVARAAYRYEYPYQYNRSDRYLDYLVDLRNLNVEEPILRQARDVLGDGVSALRVREFVLFHLGISEITE
jgi:hypothetical protein